MLPLRGIRGLFRTKRSSRPSVPPYIYPSNSRPPRIIVHDSASVYTPPRPSITLARPPSSYASSQRSEDIELGTWAGHHIPIGPTIHPVSYLIRDSTITSSYESESGTSPGDLRINEPVQIIIPPPDSSHSSATIRRSMAMNEVLEVLTSHGCDDITARLDSVGQHPIAGGGFGDVYYGTLQSGAAVSVKCIRLYVSPTDEGRKHLKHAAKELYIWSKCSHPYVLDMLGVATHRGQIAMVSPWMKNGNLQRFLSRGPQINRYTFCAQIADGVAYLHGQGIVHGDIKGANVLVSDNCTPKLTDFGNASIKLGTLNFSTTTSNAGASIRWAAPEMLSGSYVFNGKIDVYALGMTFLEVMTGQVPYANLKRDVAVITKIVAGIHPDRPEEHIPSGNKQTDLLWALLTRCWSLDPEKRPKAIEVRNEMDVLARYAPSPVGKA